MTVSYLMALMAGKYACFSGQTIDSTSFTKFNEKRIREGLTRFGMNHSGKERMFDGRTGKELQCQIYMGVISYSTLR